MKDGYFLESWISLFQLKMKELVKIAVFLLDVNPLYNNKGNLKYIYVYYCLCVDVLINVNEWHVK